MKFVWCVAACALLSLPSSPAAVTPSVDPGLTAEPLTKAVEQLGDENFKIREEATRNLWQLGAAVVPPLREALRGSNPEVIKRASFILRKIELEITPEMPGTLPELIESYGHSGKEDKLRIMIELQRLEAWRQILKLYALEKDPETRAQIRPKVEEVAIRAARNSISSGMPKEALEFLKMGPNDATGLMALAAFHRTHGSLAEEMVKAKAQGAEGAPWRLALQRAAGDFQAARASAIDAHEPRIADVMSMLDGDPLPWLRGSPAGEGAPALHTLYLQLAEKHWNGGALGPKDFEPLQPFMRDSEDIANRWVGCGIYFLLGETGPAEAAYSRLSVVNAFRYFDLLERVPEALKVMGLDPVKPDYKAWIDKRIKAILDQPDETEAERGELIAVASFMERRGLRDELKWFDPLFEKLAVDNSEVFLGLLTSLFGNEETGASAVTLGKHTAAVYAGDDDGKWGELLDTLFPQNKRVPELWTWMAQLDPSAKRSERFDGLMALMRKGIDPGHLRKRWLKLAWDAIDVMPKEQTAEKLPLMKDLAFRYQDLTTGLKALDHLKEDADEDNEEVGNQYHPLYLSAAGRWQDAATLWLKRVEANPTRADYHAHVAACLRRAGKNAEASEHDAMAEKLALADPLAGLLIGQAYSYGGDSQRASQWWQRVIMESSPENELWIKAVIRYANERTLAADWKHAAAAHEVLACDSYETGIDTISIRIRLRMNADFTRALNHLKTDRENSIKLLEKCHGLLVADGSLADYFFPALRKAGLMEQHATWFERSWHQLDSIIKTFPAGENSRNTAAWMASRAGLRLEEAEVQVDKALESAPEQAAYLDTKAEIAFARKDRKRALELSRLSLGSDPLDETLRQQFERYRSSPFLLP